MKNFILILIGLLLISQSVDERQLDSVGKLILQETMNSNILEDDDSTLESVPITEEDYIKDVDTTGGRT